jgi:hypothetical protein
VLKPLYGNVFSAAAAKTEKLNAKSQYLQIQTYIRRPLNLEHLGSYISPTKCRKKYQDTMCGRFQKQIEPTCNYFDCLRITNTKIALLQHTASTPARA